MTGQLEIGNSVPVVVLSKRGPSETAALGFAKTDHFEIANLADVEAGALKMGHSAMTNLAVEIAMSGHLEIENLAAVLAT